MSGLTLDLPPATVVMQPGTFCNLNCHYCYLPDRRKVRHMLPEVNRAVADTALRWSLAGHETEALWHLGEPLTIGVDRMAELWSLWPEGTVHSIQTNGTLIDDAWCDLFAAHCVKISVSSDGTGLANADRISWSGRPAAARIEAGLHVLRRRKIPFGMLSVVRTPSAEAARAVYGYACSVGASALGILPEEKKGSHTQEPNSSRNSWITFFSALYAEWHGDRRVKLRELESVTNCLEAILAGVTYQQLQDVAVEAIPTVSCEGNVTILSPDLVGYEHHSHGPFTVGNILEEELEDILARAHEQPWVHEALVGVSACRMTCRYASVCGGNWPANKYFELGRLDGTETAYCRNLHQAKLEGALRCHPQNP